ncbi:hypothetical protein AgCh_003296 [Apium graveolens]
MSVGPVDIDFAKADSRISAIIWAGYPGQEGGTAISDVLFGMTNPAQSYLAQVPMTNMDMRANPSKGYPGRTY